MTAKKMILNLGEPQVGAVYDIDELQALLNHFELFNNNNLYDPNLTIKKFEEDFSRLIGTKYSLAVNSGMNALEMILEALFPKGNAIIISNAINFSGTHIAVINNNSQLILCESDSSLNADIEDLLNKVELYQPDAVILTNMNGLAHNEKCINEKIKKICNKTFFITDCCRSLGSKHSNEIAGKNSDASFFSFQRKKQISTLGEGGMIVTSNDELYKKCFKIRSFGLFKTKGKNNKITGFQAAVGISQLRKLESLNIKRREIAERRTNFLQQNLIDFTFPENDYINYNVFYLYSMLVPENWTKEMRNKLIEILLKEYNIGSVIANDVTYKTSSLVKKNIKEKLIQSEKIANRIFCPIIHPSLTSSEEYYINNAILSTVRRIN